jgi:hypothetical protein
VKRQSSLRTQYGTVPTLCPGYAQRYVQGL